MARRCLKFFTIAAVFHVFATEWLAQRWQMRTCRYSCEAFRLSWNITNRPFRPHPLERNFFLFEMSRDLIATSSTSLEHDVSVPACRMWMLMVAVSFINTFIWLWLKVSHIINYRNMFRNTCFQQYLAVHRHPMTYWPKLICFKFAINNSMRLKPNINRRHIRYIWLLPLRALVLYRLWLIFHW